jgi:hypothetical protein
MHAQGREYEVSEGSIRKVWDNRENIRQRIPSYTDTFVESESATDFKGFEALHGTVLDINDQLLCFNAQIEIGEMYDELRRSFETFQRNINKPTFNAKHKKIHALATNDFA